ncbi:DinB family protein [Sinomicrobium oceani]|uniref:DinB family protein n=1 Tax=Sinomicrobium oceani TaxID=1150368 RepID=UPI00227A73C7|nr:DinB family protein [Sinomicrobium oceani]
MSSTKPKNLLIQPVVGFDKEIGILISQLQYVREITYNLIDELSEEALDFRLNNQFNSIGTILFHIAALEYSSIVKYVLNRQLTPKEYKYYFFGITGNLIHNAIKGKSVDFYKQELDKSRKLTLDKLAELKDPWLSIKDKELKKKYSVNNYFYIRHIADDESSHQGQIKWIISSYKQTPNH